MKKLLILDNYDSFTYNLAHLVEKVSDISFHVSRNDRITLEEVAGFDRIILSPGPGLPSQAGIMPALLKQYSSSRSILGICLGMQAIGECFDSNLKNLETVCHGMATPIHTMGNDTIFRNCPATFNVGRYHSWVINPLELSPDLEITAVDDNNNIMAIKHKRFDVKGLQFHPESILSEYGEIIMSNWLKD